MDMVGEGEHSVRRDHGLRGMERFGASANGEQTSEKPVYEYSYISHHNNDNAVVVSKR